MSSEVEMKLVIAVRIESARLLEFDTDDANFVYNMALDMAYGIDAKLEGIELMKGDTDVE